MDHRTVCIFVLILFVLVPAQAKVAFKYDTEHFITQVEAKQPKTIVQETNLMWMKALVFYPQIELTSATRLEKEMGTTQPICTFNRLKTAKRLSTYLFSLPTDLFLTHALYQKADEAPVSKQYLNEANALTSLSKMLIETEKTLILRGRVSYGDKLDKEISLIPSHLKVLRYDRHPYFQEIPMFMAGRGHFFLDYPATVATISRDYNIKLKAYPIEGMPAYIHGHLMCNDTAPSREFLKKLNGILPSIYASNAFLKVLKKYYLPTDFQRLRTLYLDAFQQYTSEKLSNIK